MADDSTLVQDGAPPPSPYGMMTPGVPIGDYKIVRLLGRGGMSEVYLAEQRSLGRQVALKILIQAGRDPAATQRFVREVRSLARIEHPNVVKAIEAGVEDGMCFFSMTYVPGEDLRAELDKSGFLTEKEVLRVAATMAKTLRHAWKRHGLIHRDIKPGNIIVDREGEIKLMDLGISKFTTDNSDLTIDGTMMGSPHYISPEQARAEKNLDFRSDMYSLGATCFHLVTGTPPYERSSSMMVVSCHLRDPVPDPRKRRRISKHTANLIMKMMAKDKNERFASWDEALAAINQALVAIGGEPVDDDEDDGGDEFPMDAKVGRVPDETDFQETAVEGELKAEIPDPYPRVILPPQAPPPPRQPRRPITWTRIRGAVFAALASRPFRISLLSLLLLACLVMLGMVVRDSVHIERERAKWRQFELAAKLAADRGNPAARTRGIAILEAIQRGGDERLAKLAADRLRRAAEAAAAENAAERERHRQTAWQQLKTAAARFETQNEYEIAIDFWLRYLANGEFREEFGKDIGKELEYLARRQKQWKKGL